VVLSAFDMLSLCSGYGGLDLGLKLVVPDARVVCYVEIEAYACAILASRIEEGWLDPAPVWSDLTTFDGRRWRGLVDCITAGFPCQPYSYAGKRRGTADDRWIWPDIARIIRMVGPSLVFLENVPGLLSGGLGHVLGDLADLGYDAEWDMFSASEVGAPHLRKRVFILAYTECCRWGTPERDDDARESDSVGQSQALGYSNGKRLQGTEPTQIALPEQVEPQRAGRVLGHTTSQRDSQQSQFIDGKASLKSLAGTDGRASLWHSASRATFPVRSYSEGQEDLPLWPPGAAGESWPRILERWPDLTPATERPIRGVADGAADRLDGRGQATRSHRLRALGNGVVPLTAALAFVRLWERASQ